MIREETICPSLHANRVLPMEVGNPHGPLGLEQLAAVEAARLAVGLKTFSS